MAEIFAHTQNGVSAMAEYRAAYLALACVGSCLLAETHVGDDIGGHTFEAGDGPFVVERDLTVPEDGTVVIRKGCVFLFNSFTGMNVHGSMVVEGTPAEPVVFTSVNDADYNPGSGQLPAAFDWNGIRISEGSGSVKLRNFRIMYSVYGIKSRNEKIVILNGQFRENGQFHFTIDDNIFFVQDNISYSYSLAPALGAGKGTGVLGAEQRPEISATEYHRRVRRKNVIGWSLFAVGAGTGAFASACGIKALAYRRDAESSDDRATFREFDAGFRERRNLAVAFCIPTAIAGITSIVLLAGRIEPPASRRTALLIGGALSGKACVGVAVGF